MLFIAFPTAVEISYQHCYWHKIMSQVILVGFYVLTVRQLSHSPPVTSDPLSGQQTPSAGNEQPETTGRRLYYSPTMIMCLPIYCRTKTFRITFYTVLHMNSYCYTSDTPNGSKHPSTSKEGPNPSE